MCYILGDITTMGNTNTCNQGITITPLTYDSTLLPFSHFTVIFRSKLTEKKKNKHFSIF